MGGGGGQEVAPSVLQAVLGRLSPCFNIPGRGGPPWSCRREVLCVKLKSDCTLLIVSYLDAS